MKPEKLAHMMVWSVGLFAAAYLLQRPFIYLFGVRGTATLLFLLLIISAIFAAISARVLYTHDFKGLTAFGLISMFITAILILTRYQFLGIFLFVIYAAIAIARLFKIVQADRKQAAASRSV